MRRVQNIIMYAVYWIDDDKCCLCKDEHETGLHFFYYCPDKKLFWQEFETFSFRLTKQSLQLSFVEHRTRPVSRRSRVRIPLKP